MGWIVGAVINVIGSIMINLGTNITKLGHNQTAAALPEAPPPFRKQTRLWFAFPGKKWFVCGMSIFAIGNLLNFASFGFAAQSLLAALGVVQFLSNMVFARFLNNEHITKRVMFATALVVTGCILLVSFGNHESPIITAQDLLELYSKGPYIAYLVVMAVIVVSTYFIYRHGKTTIGGLKTQRVIQGKWGRWLPVCYALFSGVLGTQSVLYGKTLSMLMRTTIAGDSQLGFWYTWLSLALFIFFAAFWLTRYSKALRLFPVSIIMPILQIVWVLFSIVAGSLYYQEYKTLNALSGSMFGLGVVILLVGIAFLTGGQRALQAEEPALIVVGEAELVPGEGGSQDNTPTMGKLLAEGPPLKGSLRHKYSSSQGDGGEGDEKLPPVPAHGTHARQASDDAGLRLFAGESSSATVWDNAVAQEAGEARQPSPTRSAKRPALRVVVEAGAGEEALSSASEGKHSMLEENDMNINFRQFAVGYAGLDFLNPLSPAFTSFSMPLVPAVATTPQLASSAHSSCLSARGARSPTLPLSRGSAGGLPLQGKHRIQRSRSAGELGDIMSQIAAEGAVPQAGSPLRQPQRPPPSPPPHTTSMPVIRSTPFDRSQTPGAASLSPTPSASTSPSKPGTGHLTGRTLGAGSAPRLPTLGTGGARRSWSMMPEHGTPVPTMPLHLDIPTRVDSGDVPGSTSSTKAPKKNPLSPRAFLEPMSPSDTQDLSQLLADKGKHD